MKIIDLSHTISPEMPVYPGTERPLIHTPFSVAVNGFMEKKITFYSHTGTHIDAPAHLIQGAKGLDQFPIGHFIGRAVSIDLTGIHSSLIRVSDLEDQRDRIRGSEFVLLNTGWSDFWGQEAYFSGFPVLDIEAAHWLAGFRLKGFGIDAISMDEVGNNELSVHRIFLGHDTCIIENLTNLKSLPSDHFTFSSFPFKIQEADGSPVRAVAIVDG